MPQPVRQLDTHIEMVTPENIAFHYRIAGPFQRLPAFLLDLLIQGAIIFAGFILLVCTGAIAALPGVGGGIGLLFLFAVWWFYAGFFETVLNGQTPGKRLLRLRVVSTNGQPINAHQAILRNLLHIVDLLPPVTYQLALWSTTLTERFQRFGDLACGTMVVVEEPQYRFGVVRVIEPEVLAMVDEIPANFAVSQSLARALSSYVLRRSAIPWHRRWQIARHVGEPLRERFGLPLDTNYDRLLCAVYQRAFFGDSTSTTAVGTPPVVANGGNPPAPLIIEPGTLTGVGHSAGSVETPVVVSAGPDEPRA